MAKIVLPHQAIPDNPGECVYPTLYPDYWWCPSLSAPGGTVLRDLGPNNSVGTLTNMVPSEDWIISDGKAAIETDGTNDFITATTRKPVTLYPFTLSIWANVKAVPGTQNPIFFVGTGSSTYFSLSFLSASGLLRVSIVGRNTTFTANNWSTNLSLNTWYHVAGVFQSATSRALYVNGVRRLTATGSVPELTTGNVARIGSGFGTLYLNALSDDARIYSKGLSDNDIRTLYNLGRGNMPIKPRHKYVFISDTGGQTITANLLSNSNTFYNPTVTPGTATVSANLFTNTNSFPSATVTPGAVTVSANLLSNTNTFPNATVTPGAANISANLHTNSNTFYNATVTASAPTQSISANLLSNSNSFYNATVTPGTATISANRLESSNSFPSATVGSTNTVTASLVPSTAQVFNPNVSSSNDIQADFVLSTAQFYSASVTSASTISADLLTNTQGFPGATIDISGFPQTVSANYVVDTNMFFDAVVAQEARSGSGLLLLGVG